MSDRRSSSGAGPGDLHQDHGGVDGRPIEPVCYRVTETDPARADSPIETEWCVVDPSGPSLRTFDGDEVLSLEGVLENPFLAVIEVSPLSDVIGRAADPEKGDRFDGDRR